MKLKSVVVDHQNQTHSFICILSYVDVVYACVAASIVPPPPSKYINKYLISFLRAENKRKADMIAQLKSRGFASDPVKAWKKSVSSDRNGEESEGEGEGEGEGEQDYNYLLSMQLWSLTRERKEELLKNRDKKVRLICVYHSMA